MLLIELWTRNIQIKTNRLKTGCFKSFQASGTNFRNESIEPILDVQTFLHNLFRALITVV